MCSPAADALVPDPSFLGPFRLQRTLFWRHRGENVKGGGMKCCGHAVVVLAGADLVELGLRCSSLTSMNTHCSPSGRAMFSSASRSRSRLNLIGGGAECSSSCPVRVDVACSPASNVSRCRLRSRQAMPPARHLFRAGADILFPLIMLRSPTAVGRCCRRGS